jgi:pimeloyl-ACP methyl ester carboxylesterase
MRRPARALSARILCALGVTVASFLPAALARAAGSPAFSASGPHGRDLPVNYSFAAGFTATAALPDVSPPGANDFSCHPSAAHPYPVILVHGTFENMDDNWQAASPLLADHGYCVFALNYGGASPSDPVQGTGDIPASARQLSAFVSRVLTATGAAKVDIVGHSQGGMMPRYYINVLGGAARVHALVGLSPSNDGTTIDGLTTLARALSASGPVNAAFGITCYSCVQQEAGSPFLAHLNARPTVPGVRYTVIETSDDEVVTPYTNAFLPPAPNVTNILVQHQCPLDASDHLEIAYDPVALADVLDALDPLHPVPVPCMTVLPAAGPLGLIP